MPLIKMASLVDYKFEETLVAFQDRKKDINNKVVLETTVMKTGTLVYKFNLYFKKDGKYYRNTFNSLNVALSHFKKKS